MVEVKQYFPYLCLCTLRDLKQKQNQIIKTPLSSTSFFFFICRNNSFILIVFHFVSWSPLHTPVMDLVGVLMGGRRGTEYAS